MRGFTGQVPTTDLPIDVLGLVLFCATFVLVTGLIVIAGVYFAFKRGPFTLTVIATIAGMLGVGLFCLGFLMNLIALVLVALSKDEFLESCWAEMGPVHVDLCADCQEKDYG